MPGHTGRSTATANVSSAVHGTEATYEEIVADYPACTVTVGDLSRNLYFTNDSVAKTQARDAAYTEMKVGV